MKLKNNATASRLRFSLTMEHPGPSQGDAFELIESLGISPWQFEEIKLVTEAVNGRVVTGTFEAVGTADLVLALLAAMLKSSA